MFPFFNLHYASNVKNNTYLQLKTFIFFDFFFKTPINKQHTIISGLHFPCLWQAKKIKYNHEKNAL